MALELTGRELDASVAEKVMGYRWKIFPGGVFLTPPATGLEGRSWNSTPDATLADIEAAKVRDLALVEDDDGNGPYTPYSTDPAAAWQVVDRFTDVVIEKAGDGYAVTISGYASATGRTMPEAVCRAALAALSVAGG